MHSISGATKRRIIMPAVAADGRTVLSYSICYRWFGNTNRETFVIDQVCDAGKHIIRLEIALAFLALLLIRLVWQSWRLSTAKLLMEQALDTATRASEEKSQFLSTMSHEIRTPLSGLLGRAKLLSRSSLKPEQREEVESISESGQALFGIIDDVLDFSKIEAGKLDLESIDYDGGALLESIDRVLGHQARAKGLDLRIEPGVDVPRRLNSDPSRIRQILLNLVGNALKFTEHGSVTLRCGIDKGELLFEVAGTGTSVAGGTASILFHPFRQGDVSTIRRHGGTGFAAGDLSKVGGGNGRASWVPEQPGGRGGVLVQTACDGRKTARGGE